MKTKSERVFGELRRYVAVNVGRLRAEQGLTFATLAGSAGLHWRHVQKIEAGDSNVTLVTIARLAQGLDVDPLTLMSKPRVR